MPPFADILLLLFLFALIVISGFFSGSETALFSLTGHEKLRLRQSAALAAGKITTLLAETRGLLITLLLGNMLVNVLYFVLSTILLIRLTHEDMDISSPVVALISILPLFVLILFGELLPKLLAARKAWAWSLLVALPLWLLHRSIAPLRITLNVAVVTPLARLIAPAEKPAQLSAEELRALLQQSQQRGVLAHDEEQLLQEVLELGQQKVRDIMTPRVDIMAFNLDSEPAKLSKLVQETQLSFIPVYEPDLDHIKGIVSARRVLLERPKNRAQIEALIDPVSYVPQVQRLDRLLVHLRDKGATLVIVVDEYGGTAGLVTLEDVVEEMLGEIAGPYVPAEGPGMEELEPGVWRVSAGLSVHDWAQAFGHSGKLFPGVNTIAGLVMARLGRLPHVGDLASIGNVQLRVDQMDRRRITWMTIRLLDAKESDTRTKESSTSGQARSSGAASDERKSNEPESGKTES